MQISSPNPIFVATPRRASRNLRSFALTALLLALAGGSACLQAQSLNVTYGNKGLQTLSYAGATFADVGAYPGDTFHIWHMKSTDLRGNVIPGWGESNQGEVWSSATKTMTYKFAWGTISTQFVQNGNDLDLIVTETNNPGSNIVLDGAEIYPLTMHFPQDPAGFSGYSQYAITTTGPAVSAADFGSGIVTSVVPDESVPMYGGWKNLAPAVYSPLMVTTAPDGLPSFLPSNDNPVPPGSNFTYTVSLRFTPEGTPASASDAYSSFAATYPSQMTWTDKRIIGTAYLASSPPSNGNSTRPGGFPTNPRRYFNDPSVDVTTPAGLQSFQNRMLAQARQNVASAQAFNSQGVVTWDVEGEQYPQATSYVCSPDQIAAVAPEMESTVSDRTSAYFGQKLDDAYFRTMTSAGLKIGVCLRPQLFTVAADGSATQGFLSTNAAIVANLENKARFANSRWGATMFYVDSTVDVHGGTLDPAIFQQLITDLPSFLFMPEESTPRYYAYSAPFYSFIFHTSLGTPASTYNFYPKAFGANLINDVSATTLAAYLPQLTQSVVNGDILMGHADYWQANDPTLVSIYGAAGSSGPPPMQVTPLIAWPAPAPIAFGTPLSSVQLNASANTLGSFVFTPAAGTVLGAGPQLLLATFSPNNTKDYTPATASVNLPVTQAVPVLLWGAPSPIAAGTALSGAQLNASANIPGSFAYAPSSGAVLGPGSHVLQVTFNPNDATDYSSSTTSVSMTVNASAPPQTPVISWFNPAPIVYGQALGNAQLNASSDISGAFTYSPGANTLLHAGNNTLSAIFTPTDTAEYNSVSASVNLTVSPASPSLAWAQPLGIIFGTALSGTQLNASSNIPGNFAYAPGPGTVLQPGTQALAVTFTPADGADYASAAASVPLTVIAAPPASSSKLAITAPAQDGIVSGMTTVVAHCSLTLDSAGTYLMVDGVEAGRRVTDGPFMYPLDTTTLSNGPHTLQLWGHDIGNNITLSDIVSVTVAN